MKLFQQLLVAPAALGLLAPVAVNATELNLNAVSDYSEPAQEIQNFSDIYPSDWAFQALVNLAEGHGCSTALPTSTITRYEAATLLNKCLENVSALNQEEKRLLDEFAPELAVIKGRVDVLQSNVVGFEAGQFSSTTEMSGAAVFAVANPSDGGTADTGEDLYMNYSYALDLNTSFTGDDLLYTGIEAGNYSGVLASMDAASDVGEGLKVTSMFYAFPLGDFEITFGPLLDQDDVIAATPSVYSDAFRHGSMPFSVAGDETGPGAAVSWSNKDGLVASFSLVSVDGTDSTLGINGDGVDVTTFTAGWNGDEFGGGLVVTSNDGGGTTTGYDTFGGGVYWTPEAWPTTVSITYDTKDPETGEDSQDWFLGVEYEGVGPGLLGWGYHSTDVDGGDASDEVGYELTYTYPVNDNISITPGFFYVEETTAGKEDDTAFFVETVFSF